MCENIAQINKNRCTGMEHMAGAGVRVSGVRIQCQKIGSQVRGSRLTGLANCDNVKTENLDAWDVKADV